MAALKAAIEKAHSAEGESRVVPRTTSTSLVTAPYQISSLDDVPEPDPVAPKYTFADLSHCSLSSSLHKVPPSVLAKFLSDVVAVESPVHWMEAARRVANAAGVSRIGGRIRDAFQYACKYGHNTNEFVSRDDFLWADKTQSVTVRDRSDFPGAVKKLEFIAPEEICAAIEKAVSDSYGLERQDIPTSACRLLGFSRTTEDIWAVVDPLCDKMLREDRLVMRGNTIIAKNGKEHPRR